MKLVKSIKFDNYHEIEIETSFLWFKKRVKYRKFINANTIFRYKDKNKYYALNFSEAIQVNGLFNISPEVIN
jgi:hypothetical protein